MADVLQEVLLDHEVEAAGGKARFLQRPRRGPSGRTARARSARRTPTTRHLRPPSRWPAPGRREGSRARCPPPATARALPRPPQGAGQEVRLALVALPLCGVLPEAGRSVGNRSSPHRRARPARRGRGRGRICRNPQPAQRWIHTGPRPSRPTSMQGGHPIPRAADVTRLLHGRSSRPHYRSRAGTRLRSRGMVQRPTDGATVPEFRSSLHSRLPGAARRCRQPGPRVRGGRRQAPVHRPRAGRAVVRRRRPELHRLRHVVGAR